ncbi:MAG: hypothetical protein CMJ59_20150 [Planctomycetaceae bacterium]|nr:hypothetical protein [Planctomycetaceae bacterium]
MSRVTTFLVGAACGGALVFTSLKYHVVRAGDGLDGIIFVRKLSAEFDDAYVDIRDFDAQEWNRHEALKSALTKANRSELIRTENSLMDNVFKPLRSNRSN